MVIQGSFYKRDDVVTIARELLGKYLFTQFNGVVTAGIISETEAYSGVGDRASHAYNGRRTQRTEIMYAEGGVAYIYLCYGIHSLFNIVTGKKDDPKAVLVRGIVPVIGLAEMMKRAGRSSLPSKFGKGPGVVSKVLGIHFSQSGASLQGERIWLEDKGIAVVDAEIEISRRIGVEYAGIDARLPYRFMIDHDLVRKKITGPGTQDR